MIKIKMKDKINSQYMVNQEEIKKKIEKAKEKVKSMDKVDGWKDRSIGMILSAFKCGIEAGDENALFESYVMLDDLVAMVGRTFPYNQEGKTKDLNSGGGCI